VGDILGLLSLKFDHSTSANALLYRSILNSENLAVARKSENSARTLKTQALRNPPSGYALRLRADWNGEA
jgi:phage tail sheath protein FI